MSVYGCYGRSGGSLAAQRGLLLPRGVSGVVALHDPAVERDVHDAFDGEHLDHAARARPADVVDGAGEADVADRVDPALCPAVGLRPLALGQLWNCGSPRLSGVRRLLNNRAGSGLHPSNPLLRYRDGLPLVVRVRSLGTPVHPVCLCTHTCKAAASRSPAGPPGRDFTRDFGRTSPENAEGAGTDDRRGVLAGQRRCHPETRKVRLEGRTSFFAER